MTVTGSTDVTENIRGRLNVTEKVGLVVETGIEVVDTTETETENITEQEEDQEVAHAGKGNRKIEKFGTETDTATMIGTVIGIGYIGMALKYH